MTFPSITNNKDGTTDTDRRKAGEGSGYEEDKLGRYIKQSNYQTIREVKPDTPEWCYRCDDDLEQFKKVYIVEREGKGDVVFCPVCATQNKVKNIL